MYLIRGATRR